MSQIINATDSIRLSVSQKKIIKDVANDLKCIKIANPVIDEIVVRGGFFADVYFGSIPSDVDLFYSLKGNDKSICRCDQIRTVIDKMELRVVKNQFVYDLENSFEKEPMLNPIERTVGYFSYHTDWLSMFCITSQGEIWTNTKSFTCLQECIHEIRHEGFIPWGFYPKSTDANNYFLLLAYEVVRGLAHMKRRELLPGACFIEHMTYWKYLVTNVEKCGKYDQLAHYAEKKCGSMEDVSALVRRYTML